MDNNKFPPTTKPEDYQLRYLLRISQEYDNNTKTIKNVLLNLNWEGNWKGNDLTSLGHKLTGLAVFLQT